MHGKTKRSGFIVFAVDCRWSDFGEWSNCSADCGDGEQERSRTIEIAAAFGGAECTGSENETQVCKIKECPGMVIFFAITYMIAPT